MVLDEVGGVPILASWWPLSATAMVHRRDIDGRGVVFGNQGDLYMNAMTWCAQRSRRDAGSTLCAAHSSASAELRRPVSSHRACSGGLVPAAQAGCFWAWARICAAPG
jgi:hypothetical protein